MNFDQLTNDPLLLLIALLILVGITLVSLSIIWLMLQTARLKRKETRAEAFQRDLAKSFDEAAADDKAFKKWLSRARRYPDEAVRDLLDLKIATDRDGSSLPRILEAYKSLGFERQDKSQLQSGFWHRRIAALRRIQHAVGPESKNDLISLGKDIHAIRVLVARVIGRIGDSDDLFTLLRDFHLHRRLMEQPIMSLLSELPRETFLQLLEKWDQFECTFLRRILLIHAAEVDKPAAKFWLAKAAEEESEDVRIGACIAAGIIADDNAFEILNRLSRDEHWEVRASAIKSLKRFDNDRALEILRKALSDSAFWVRQNAAATMTSFGPKGREILQSITKNSSDGFAIDAAAQELERLRFAAASEGGRQ